MTPSPLITRTGRQILCAHLRTTLAIDTCRHYAAGIARALATREQARHCDVLKRHGVACHAHRRTGTCLHGYEHGLVGEETVTHTSELAEALTQT